MRAVETVTKTTEVQDVTILVEELNLSNLKSEIDLYKNYDKCFYSSNPIDSFVSFFKNDIVSSFSSLSPEFKKYWHETSSINSYIETEIVGTFSVVSDSLGWLAFSYDDETTSSSTSSSYNPQLKSKLQNSSLYGNFDNGLGAVNSLFYQNTANLSEYLSVKDTSSSGAFSNIINSVYNYTKTFAGDMFETLPVSTEFVGDLLINPIQYDSTIESGTTKIDFFLNEILPQEKREKLELLKTL